MTKQKEIMLGKVELPFGGGLGLTITMKPDINLVTEHKLFPINTRFEREDSRCYRYIVDKKGYRWIGEELWILGGR